MRKASQHFCWIEVGTHNIVLGKPQGGYLDMQRYIEESGLPQGKKVVRLL